MIAPAWALLAATAAIALGDFVNRKVYGWLPEDPPRPGRKQHLRPMPLAGVLVVPAMLPWLIADRAFLPLLAVAVAAAIGFVDDRRKESLDQREGEPDDGGLDWRIKAVGLFAAAGLCASSHVDLTAAPGRWALACGLAFVLINATNFLDNTDGVGTGLAASTLLWVGLATPSATWLSAAGFAALALLPWNWPAPRLFLGDGGAYALGVAVATALGGAVHGDWTLLLAAAVPLTDFTQVVIMRVCLGLPPWVGDRRHLTHIAQNLGVPRVLVMPLFVGLAGGAWLLRPDA